jgi:hypothetical protein
MTDDQPPRWEKKQFTTYEKAPLGISLMVNKDWCTSSSAIEREEWLLKKLEEIPSRGHYKIDEGHEPIESDHLILLHDVLRLIKQMRNSR